MAKSRVLQTQENRITRGFGNGHSGVDLGWQTTQTDGILAHSDGKVARLGTRTIQVPAAMPAMATV